MKETMKPVSHQQASQLLHNKFVVVLGDSIQRSVYKDLVLLLQKDKYLSVRQLKDKGEMTFEQDCLVEGGCLSPMHNGTDYREVRQFRSSHHLVRFYFVTRIYSRYMQSVLENFRHGLKPDVVIVNSCLWDISRYKSPWLDDYRENLHKFFGELREILPEETLVIWNLTMPLGGSIKGGFLVPEIEHKAPQLRYDVIDGNFYSGTLADAYGMDVLDLHFHFRFSLHHRTKDGIHWNALAHRKITSLLLQHIAEAWGVIMPCSLTTVEHPEVTAEQPEYGNATKSTAGVYGASNYSNPPSTNYSSNMEGYYDGYREQFYSDSIPCGYLDFENIPRPRRYKNGRAYRPALLPLPHPPVHRHQYANGFNYRPPHHFEPYNNRYHQQVMKSRHARHHYAPSTNYSSNMEHPEVTAGQPAYDNATKSTAEHPEVTAGQPAYGNATKSTAEHPEVTAEQPAYGNATQSTAEHPEVTPGQPAYGNATKSTAEHPEVTAGQPAYDNATKSTAEHPEVPAEQPAYGNATKSTAEHPEVTAGQPAYGNATKSTAEHPEVTAEQPAYGNATQSTAEHPEVTPGQPAYGNATKSTAEHPEVTAGQPAYDNATKSTAEHPEVPAEQPAYGNATKSTAEHPEVTAEQPAYDNATKSTAEHPEVTGEQPAYDNATKSTAGVYGASNYSNPPSTNYSSNMEGYYDGYREEFYSDSIPRGFLDFENIPWPRRYENGGAYRPALSPLPHPPVHRHQYANGFDYRPPHHFEPYNNRYHQQVMKSRHARHHYAPYTHHRPSRYNHRGCYY